MKKLRILVLMHEDLVPPETLEGVEDKEMMVWKTEFDVTATLRDMGHEVRSLGVRDDLGPIRDALVEWQPQIAFNLLEEFHSVASYDHHVVTYLELMRQPYTGCNPRGLLLSHDKVLAKQIIGYHRMPMPRFTVFRPGRAIKKPRRLGYPLLVKSTVEDASLGISQASIVHNDEKLQERVAFVHERLKSEALVEEYIEGREFYVGVLGNERLQTFPAWELQFSNMPPQVARIATTKVKWDLAYQKKHGITTVPAKDLPPGAEQKLARISKRVYRILHLSGYARMDFRMDAEGRFYILEANANPNLAYGEDFAESAEASGIGYEALLTRIMNLGLRYRAAWRV